MYQKTTMKVSRETLNLLVKIKSYWQWKSPGERISLDMIVKKLAEGELKRIEKNGEKFRSQGAQK